MVNIQTIHPCFKNNLFRYATTMKINLEDNCSEKHHRILTKERGPGKKWIYLGDANGPFNYPTEEAALEDVKKLNVWKKKRQPAKAV